ncbi:hypothetical protein ACIBG7_20035 [Nonomuraea sp. NPDC050328]|uniref:hypothetical protein n=1 Tax=Nonomuraea sp. NPDC050328 TaxID=3364361 RepID=UPI0037A8D9A8
MSRRSRRRRVFPGGEPGPLPGFGPGEPHWSGPEDDDDPRFEDPGGGVREPRRPKPAPPSIEARAPLPETPLETRVLVLD